MKAFFPSLSFHTHLHHSVSVCGYKCHPATGQDDIFTHKHILALQLLIKSTETALKKSLNIIFHVSSLHRLFVCLLFVHQANFAKLQK